MNLKRIVATLSLAWIVSPAVFAQTKQEKQEFKEWKKLQDRLDRVSERGTLALEGNTELTLALHEGLKQLKSPIRTTEEDALKRLLGTAARNGAPGTPVYFHYLYAGVKREFSYCWAAIAEQPDADGFFEEFMDDLNAENPDAVSCALSHTSDFRMQAECVVPALTKVEKDEEPTFKSKLRLFSYEDRVERSGCLAKITVGSKRVVDPHVEQVPTGMKPVLEHHWIKPPVLKVGFDLEAALGKYIDKLQKSLFETAEKERARIRREVNKSINEKIGDIEGNLMFGIPVDDTMAFLVDNSASIASVKQLSIDNLIFTVRELQPNQRFTIGFLSDEEYYFNDGMALEATPENIEKAVAFLESMRKTTEGSAEPFDHGLARVRKIPNLQKIYFFGDGQWDSPVQQECLRFAEKEGIPINVRPMADADAAFLQAVADKSGGVYYEQPFKTAIPDHFAVDIQKAKMQIRELQKQRTAALQEVELSYRAELEKIRIKIENLRKRLKGENGICPPVK